MPHPTVAALLLSGLLLLSNGAAAAEFRNVSADTLKAWIRDGHPMTVVDIQPRGEFQEGHFDGALSAAGGARDLDRVARGRIAVLGNGMEGAVTGMSRCGYCRAEAPGDGEGPQ